MCLVIRDDHRPTENSRVRVDSAPTDGLLRSGNRETDNLKNHIQESRSEAACSLALASEPADASAVGSFMTLEEKG